jgi:hypothetical protein
MPKFEVGVYNSEVRAALKAGKRHRDLTDDWADIHYFDIEAEDAQAARQRMERKYPPDRGYVVDSVEQHKY